MDRFELARTIEARIEADPDLAKTLVNSPRLTIEPRRHASSRGLQALSKTLDPRLAHEVAS